MRVINNTSYPIEDIKKMEPIGKCRNNWRQRNITLYQHPTLPDRILSIGIHFNEEQTIVCDELKQDHRNTLEAFPKTYIYE